MAAPAQPPPQAEPPPIAPAPSTGPPAQAPAPAPAGRGGGPSMVLVGLVAAAILAGGGVAAALILSGKDDKPPRQEVAQPVPIPEAEPPTDPTTAEPSTPAEPPPAAPEPSPADLGPDPSSPEGVMTRYWTAIDEGRYDTAAKLYSEQWPYKAGYASKEATYDPGVDEKTLEVSTRTPASNRDATVTVDVVTYDRAGDDQGVCKHWGGWVRLIREGGKWRYLPGPNFSTLETLSPSDRRCVRARKG
jgi:hypothetical protein